MFSPQEIARVLFLDIETVRATQHYEELPESLRAMWEHKCKNIQLENKPEASPEEKYYERAGIYAEFGRVVCISFGFVFWQGFKPYLKIKSLYGEDEKQILAQFKNLLDDDKMRRWLLCAHNGKEFDFPYLCRRYLINQIPLPKILTVQGKKPWEVPFLDTMELWKFGDYKGYTKLELLCAVFGIPSPKGDIDGSQVGQVYWEEKDIQRIAKYCAKDVEATVQVFMKFSTQPMIEPFHVQSN